MLRCAGSVTLRGGGFRGGRAAAAAGRPRPGFPTTPPPLGSQPGLDTNAQRLSGLMYSFWVLRLGRCAGMGGPFWVGVGGGGILCQSYDTFKLQLIIMFYIVVLFFASGDGVL